LQLPEVEQAQPAAPLRVTAALVTEQNTEVFLAPQLTMAPSQATVPSHTRSHSPSPQFTVMS
jgi:hypothetical protein